MNTYKLKAIGKMIPMGSIYLAIGYGIACLLRSYEWARVTLFVIGFFLLLAVVLLVLAILLSQFYFWWKDGIKMLLHPPYVKPWHLSAHDLVGWNLLRLFEKPGLLSMEDINCIIEQLIGEE